METEFDKKKVLALVGIVAATGLIGYIIYVVFFKSAAPAAVTTPTEQTAGGGLSPSGQATPGTNVVTPQAPEQQVFSSASQISPLATAGSKIVSVTPIVTLPTVGVTAAANGNDLQFYNSVDGKFYKINSDGTPTTLTPDSFPNVKTVEWSPNKSLAAMSFPDGSKIVYDFKAQKQYTLPKHWDSITFSPDSTQLYGKTQSPDPELRFLFSSNVDGTGATPIEPLGNNGDKVIIAPSPNNQVIAFSNTADPIGGGAERMGMLLIGKNHENFKQMTIEGLGFQPKWSPNGDKVLYSAYNRSTGLAPILWVDGGTDSTVGQLKNAFPIKTWASKCTFASNDEAICAVPNPDTLLPGIGFAPQLATNTDDTIYKINLKSGLQTIVGKPDGNRTISEVTASEDGQYLYMKDQNSGELLKMRLK